MSDEQSSNEQKDGGGIDWSGVGDAISSLSGAVSDVISGNSGSESTDSDIAAVTVVEPEGLSQPIAGIPLWGWLAGAAAAVAGYLVAKP